MQLQRKRTSELNTVEMAQVIGGAFFELASMGVDITTGNIANYWIEWYNWRGKQGSDPFTDIGKSIDQYKKEVPFCEACTKGLISRDEYGRDMYAGQMAHIVSRGAGGSDELWNLMHLCTDCHIHLQHQKGWGALTNKYPHIAWRVARAYNKTGNLESLKSDPAYSLVVEASELFEKENKAATVELIKDVFGGRQSDEQSV